MVRNAFFARNKLAAVWAGLCDVRVLIRAIGRALDVLLVDKRLDALLDHPDGRSERDLGLAQNLRQQSFS